MNMKFIIKLLNLSFILVIAYMAVRTNLIQCIKTIAPNSVYLLLF